MSRTNERHWNGGMPTDRLSFQLAWFGFLGLALFTTGCGLFKPRASAPKATVASLQPPTNRVVGSVSLLVLQAETMRFADNYATIVAQAADDFGQRMATPDARLAALKWKLGQATAAYVDASGPHPVLNALDLVVLTTVARMVVEDYGVGEGFGDSALPLLETHRRLETNAWLLVGAVLKSEQRQELTEMIQKWRQNNPHQRYVGGIRFGELAVALGESAHQKSASPTSVFSLLFMDPLASMDPTASALQEARYAAERAMYYAQRMPLLLNWQVEVLAGQLAAQPESKQILSNAQRLVSSAEIFVETSKQLPQQLTNVFVSEEKRMRELLSEARQTLSTGNDMATSVNAAIKSLDEFVRFVTPTNSPSVRDTNSPPFNVLDYGTRSEEHTSELQSLRHLVCRLLLEKKKKK